MTTKTASGGPTVTACRKCARTFPADATVELLADHLRDDHGLDYDPSLFGQRTPMELALEAVENGYAVWPISSNSQHASANPAPSRDPARVREWWTKDPAAQVGLGPRLAPSKKGLGGAKPAKQSAFLHKDELFTATLRVRVNDALRTRGDVVGAVLDTLTEHELRRMESAHRIVSMTQRVEVLQNTAGNTYRIFLRRPDAEGRTEGEPEAVIELDQEEFSLKPNAFRQKALQLLNEWFPPMKEAEWGAIVTEWISPERCVRLAGIEEVNEERLAVEAIRDRIRRFNVTREIKALLERDDFGCWVEEGDDSYLLVTSEQLERARKAFAETIPSNRLGELLRMAGLVDGPSRLRRIPGETIPKRFWAFNTRALGVTVDRIQTVDPLAVPPLPSDDDEAEPGGPPV